VISPILANIFLHTVLDEWFETTVRARRRRIAWHLAVVPPLVVAFLTVLLIFQGTVFDPREWLTPSYFMGTTPIGIYMLFTFAISAGIGLIPALFIIWFYRRRLADEERLV
jgi:protein-S-isoprenylcysteine O-methyltransferase Ste14